VKNSISSSNKNLRLTLARAGELYARKTLAQAGWRIKTTNWRAGRFAEIDIIACEPGNTLVFIEVKTRKSPTGEMGFVNSGFDAIGWRKREKIMIAASLYMAQNRYVNRACRFDAIIVYYPIDKNYKIGSHLPQPEVNHVIGIF
jgi:uncharacterized protein (TIGR00252 family)